MSDGECNFPVCCPPGCYFFVCLYPSLFLLLSFSSLSPYLYLFILCLFSPLSLISPTLICYHSETWFLRVVAGAVQGPDEVNKEVHFHQKEIATHFLVKFSLPFAQIIARNHNVPYLIFVTCSLLGFIAMP